MEKLSDILRQTRIKKSLTIEQVENETRIRKDYLIAMENEQWEVFPNYIYLKSFLRTYSRYLEIDKSEYVLYLIEELKPKPQPQQSPPEKIELVTAPRRKTGIFLGILAIVLLFSMSSLYQQYLNPFSNNENEGIVSPNEQDEAKNRDQENESDQTEWGHEQKQPEMTDSEQKSPEQSQDEGIEIIELTLNCVDDRCWVEVKNNADEFIYRRTIVKGEQISFTDLQKITVKLGNAGQVQVLLNDNDLGFLGEIGEVVTRTYVLEDAEIKEL